MTDPSSGFDPGQMADAVTDLADSFGGQLNALVSRGFEREDASRMISYMVVGSAADGWQVVGRMWGRTDPEATE